MCMQIWGFASAEDHKVILKDSSAAAAMWEVLMM